MRLSRLLLVPLAVVSATCSRSDEQRSGAPTGGSAGASAGAGDALPCIAPIITRSCATTDCHDAVTHEHSMDLSTGEGIYDAWLGPSGTGRNGLDHCGNRLRPRVVPGLPTESYVLAKITGMLDCQGELSKAMPPPPLPALSTDEVSAIRSWIANGATLDCSVRDGGRPPMGGAGGSASGGGAGSSSSGGAASGGTGAGVGTGGGETGGGGAGGEPNGGSAGDLTDGGALDGGDDGGVDDFYVCTDARACTEGLLCVGYECGIPWECQGHYIEPDDAGTLEHPCPPETATYCGCDGVTYVAQNTCPTKPYRYPGDCGSGYNCDPLDFRCGEEPICPAGEAPSIGFDNCWSDCVSSTSCRCEYSWECPTGYMCDDVARYCVVRPPPDGGT